jgi:hypothetical protein
MNSKRGLFLLFIAAYYLIIAGIFLNRLNAEPPNDNDGYFLRHCFLPNPVGEWHHQTNKIYFICVVFVLALPSIIWIRWGLISGKGRGIFWRKGLDRVLIVIGTVWFFYPPGVIIYGTFFVDLGAVSLPAILVWYIAGFVALFVVGFFRKQLMG